MLEETKAAEPYRSKPQKNPEKNVGSNHILILGEENFLTKLMEQEKTKNNKMWIFIAIVAIAVAAYFIYQPISGGSKYKISFPFTQSVASNTTFACEAL